MPRITRKRISLPPPPRVASSPSTETATESAADAKKRIEHLLAARDEALRRVEAFDAEIERAAVESICGFMDDTQHVELYDGTLGVTREFVVEHEPPIGQLQWLSDLTARFAGPHESPGDVSGARWGSGAMISAELYLTAGHCFDSTGGGWMRPSRNGATILPAEIAALMQVNFNYQINSETAEIRAGEGFPILKLLEYRLNDLDFAIVQLGSNAKGKLPGEKYGFLATATEDLTRRNAMLAMIQHPAGSPKKIEAGPMVDNDGGRITYDSLDTLGGSSGAPIQSLDGSIVGVHTNGGCSTFSGSNRGVAIGAILAASDQFQ